MSIDEGVSFSLEINVQKAYEEVRKLQTIVYRTLALVKQLTGNEELDAAITRMQRAISIANQLRLTMAATQATMGPIGWAMLAVSTAATITTTQEFIEDELRGR